MLGGGILNNARVEIEAHRAEIVALRIRQESFVTQAKLNEASREMREDMTAQFKQLREDLPVIVRAAMIRAEARR
jgi:hypothetical protein